MNLDFTLCSHLLCVVASFLLSAALFRRALRAKEDPQQGCNGCDCANDCGCCDCRCCGCGCSLRSAGFLSTWSFSDHVKLSSYRMQLFTVTEWSPCACVCDVAAASGPTWELWSLRPPLPYSWLCWAITISLRFSWTIAYVTLLWIRCLKVAFVYCLRCSRMLYVCTTDALPYLNRHDACLVLIGLMRGSGVTETLLQCFTTCTPVFFRPC